MTKVNGNKTEVTKHAVNMNKSPGRLGLFVDQDEEGREEDVQAENKIG